MRLLVPSLVLSVVLGGCSIDPGATWAPDLLKDKAAAAAAPEQPPQMRPILQTRLAEFFLPSANASNVSFSAPRPAGAEWTICLRATVNGATGGSLGEQTYYVSIEKDKPVRQEHVDSAHWCHQEKYERL